MYASLVGMLITSLGVYFILNEFLFNTTALCLSIFSKGQKIKRQRYVHCYDQISKCVYDHDIEW